MDKKDVLKQLEIVNEPNKKPKRVIRIGKKDAQDVEGAHPVFSDESALQEPVQEPDKYFVDKRMNFFDRALAFERIQKIMKGEVVDDLVINVKDAEPKGMPKPPDLVDVEAKAFARPQVPKSDDPSKAKPSISDDPSKSNG